MGIHYNPSKKCIQLTKFIYYTPYCVYYTDDYLSQAYIEMQIRLHLIILYIVCEVIQKSFFLIDITGGICRDATFFCIFCEKTCRIKIIVLSLQQNYDIAIFRPIN